MKWIFIKKITLGLLSHWGFFHQWSRRFRAVQTRVFGFFAPKTHKKQKTSSKNARTTHTIDRNFIEYSTTIHLKGLEKFTILQNEPWICCGKISIVNLTEGNMFLMLKWSPGTYFLKIRFTISKVMWQAESRITVVCMAEIILMGNIFP